MASSGDPMADIMNVQGYAGLVGPNPYLQYQGQIPMAGYAGIPTDAEGRPIQSYLDAMKQQPTPGTTLNTPPPAPITQLPPSGPSNIIPGSSSGVGPGGIGAGSPNTIGANLFLGPGSAPSPAQMSQQQAAPAPAPQASGPDMRQAYLNALANPGPVPQYGAVMQPGTAQTGSPQPSVLNAFLAAHPSGGTSVPGGYSNTGFFNTLNQLQAQKGATQ
jgi:hypothetical protein